jgi:tetratricopeptide (TPR) repeat protein
VRNKPKILLRLSFMLSLTAASRLEGTGDNALTEGKRAFNAGNFHEAVRILRGIRSDPSQCEASFYLGVAHYRLKQLDQAIIDLQSASRCDPKNCQPQIALAQVYSEKGNENLAVAALEAALRIKPDDVTALRSLAAFYLRRELHQPAIEKLETLTALDPTDLKARSDLGAAYAGSGDLERARELFQQVLRLRSDQPSALVGLGNVYLKTSRTEEAIALLTQAEKLEPQAYEVRFLLGTALANQGRSSEAVTRFQEAIRLGGKDPEIYYHLARAYRSLGRENESRQALARFAQVRSQSNAAVEASREAARLLEQARPLVEGGKLQEAIALLENALRLDPANPRLRFRLAGLYFDTRQYEAARLQAREAILVAPAEWLYHYLLGLVEQADGNVDPARESLETAVRLNPSAAQAFNQLGNLAMTRQDYAEAVRQFRKASQLEPHEAAYQLNLKTAERLMER